MGDEEYDYMSEDFLNKCVESNDVRPGLMRSHKQVRDHNLLKKKVTLDKFNKKQNQPRSMIQAERLEEGLQQPIASTNKGFSMLEKMGFKPGSGLGKTNSGIVEPVGISIKNDRMGFGRAEALKQIKMHKRQIRMKHANKQINVEDYRNMLSKKSKEREIIIDLRKSQRTCHQLDTKSGVAHPAEYWFWPEDCLLEDEEKAVNERESGESVSNSDEKSSPKEIVTDEAVTSTVETVEEDEDDSEEVEYEPSEQLEMLTNYLRQMFYYCVWCGVQYEDEKDLQDCPGPTRDEH